VTNGENLVTAHIREQLRSAQWLLEETFSDVTDEMAHYVPQGKALPIGAAYAHFITGADWMIYAMFQGGTPMFAGTWAGRTGLSELQPGPDPMRDWAAEFHGWCRRVRIDLTAFRAYAKEVFAASDAYLAALPDAELARPLDLSMMGMGTQTMKFVLDNALIGHAFCHCGEISAMKGLLGKKGYPF
jgi:hypothetical protein